MPDLEDLVRRTLQDHYALAPGGYEDLLDSARQRRRRRRTWSFVGVSAVLTAAAAVLPLAVISQRHTSASPAPASHAPSGVASSPSSPAPDTGQAGSLVRMFTVASTLHMFVGGPAPMQQRTCRPLDITATGQLRRFTTGTYGVVQLHAEHCAIPMGQGPTALVDAAKHRLDIPLAADTGLNGTNSRPDLAFANGGGAWGFAITGSWCGSVPTGVVIPLANDPTAPASASPSITVPLTGAQPQCTGTSNAELVRGVPGRIGDSVLPPPASWASLTARINLPARPPYGRGATITLGNPTGHDIPLDPCPHYWVVAGFHFRDGSSEDVGGGGGLLNCQHMRTVAAHSQATLRLDPFSVASDGIGTPVKAKIRISLAAGITAETDLPLK